MPGRSSNSYGGVILGGGKKNGPGAAKSNFMKGGFPDQPGGRNGNCLGRMWRKVLTAIGPVRNKRSANNANERRKKVLPIDLRKKKNFKWSGGDRSL